jgi:hypothetical protein
MHVGVRTPRARQTRSSELAELRTRPRCTKCFMTSPGPRDFVCKVTGGYPGPFELIPTNMVNEVIKVDAELRR